MKGYVVTGPQNISTSAGVQALHKLHRDLLDYGCKSRFIPDLRAGDGNTVDNDREIVLYPDCYNGNVLGAKNVVRLIFMYVGYFPGTDQDFPASEMMYYNSPDMVHQGREPENILGVPMILEDRFTHHRPGVTREGSCYLAIKAGRMLGPGPWMGDLPDDCTPITHETNVSDLFHRKKKLITFDNSAMNIEAALAGMDVEFRPNPATPHLHRYEQFSWETSTDICCSYFLQKSRYYSRNLPAFIERTQARYA